MQLQAFVMNSLQFLELAFLFCRDFELLRYVKYVSGQCVF